MTKEEALKGILTRVGDPNALSTEWKQLAWDLFIESVYEAEPSLSLVESKNLIRHSTFTEAVNANGCIVYDMDWSAYSNIAEIVVRTDIGNVVSNEITLAEYAAMVANPYMKPSFIGDKYEPRFYHCYDKSNLVILTPYTEGKILTCELRVYPDIRELLQSLEDTSFIPLHNQLITRLIPIVANKLKAEIGIVI